MLCVHVFTYETTKTLLTKLYWTQQRKKTNCNIQKMIVSSEKEKNMKKDIKLLKIHD